MSTLVRSDSVFKVKKGGVFFESHILIWGILPPLKLISTQQICSLVSVKIVAACCACRLDTAITVQEQDIIINL